MNVHKLDTTKGYPMLQNIGKAVKNQCLITFIALGGVEVGDTLTNKFKKYTVEEITEEREPNGIGHSEGAVFYEVRVTLVADLTPAPAADTAKDLKPNINPA